VILDDLPGHFPGFFANVWPEWDSNPLMFDENSESASIIVDEEDSIVFDEEDSFSEEGTEADQSQDN
jgi:hypothetical protein